MNIGGHHGMSPCASGRIAREDSIMEKRLAVSIMEAAEICGVGKSTIYRLIDRGEIKRRKLGNRALILLSDLNTYLNSLEDG